MKNAEKAIFEAAAKQSDFNLLDKIARSYC